MNEYSSGFALGFGLALLAWIAMAAQTGDGQMVGHGLALGIVFLVVLAAALAAGAR